MSDLGRSASSGLGRFRGVADYSSGMSIPVPPEIEPDASAAAAACWAELDAEHKRATLLRTAGEVFARDGLDAPMPAIAAAARAGVGSVYRQFPSKRDLLAALVVERLSEMEGDVDVALASPDGPWPALTGVLWSFAGRQAADHVFGEAMATVSEHPDVECALARTIVAIERLLAAARADGSLRADATALDIRLLFAATRAAAQLEPEGWRRMLELGIDALERRS